LLRNYTQAFLKALPGNGIDIVRQTPRLPATAYDKTLPGSFRINFKEKIEVRGIGKGRRFRALDLDRDGLIRCFQHIINFRAMRRAPEIQAADMVIFIGIPIKSLYSPAKFQFLYQSRPGKDLQVSINRIQADMGELFSHQFIDFVRTRMGICLS